MKKIRDILETYCSAITKKNFNIVSNCFDKNAIITYNNTKYTKDSNILELLSDSDSDQDIPRLNYNTENG
jgi:hypothetical protein